MNDAVGNPINRGDRVAYIPRGGKGAMSIGYVHHLNPKTISVVRKLEHLDDVGAYGQVVPNLRAVVVP